MFTRFTVSILTTRCKDLQLCYQVLEEDKPGVLAFFPYAADWKFDSSLNRYTLLKQEMTSDACHSKITNPI